MTGRTLSFISEKLLIIAGIEPKHELFYSCESINGCKNEAYKVADLSIEVSTTHERYDVTNVFIIPRLSAGKRAMRRILEGNSHLRGLSLAESYGDV